MTYTEQIKSILEKSGVDTSALPDNLYSTLLNALLNAEMGGGGLTREEVEKIVTDEVAKIVADAPEDFDTLKEMSDWISQHEDSVAAMNSAIQQNATDISDNTSAIQTNANNISKNETNISTLIERLANVEKRVTTISHVYGIYIDGNNFNPSTRVTYIEDAIGMKPAFMNYETDKFDYGSWGNAWFMPRPCMLKSDGTVAYYLDPMDYSKKIDGTDSDISNDDFDGNAMMEWGTGGKKIWTKTVPVLGDPTSCYKYFADEQIDPDYHAYSFIGSDGKLKDHFYTPIYHGSVVGTKLRSLSGKAPCMSKTAQQEIDLATSNGNGWYVEQFCDIELINDLLVLMGKSTDTQTVFGKGNSDGYVNDSSINYGMINSGTMDDKGLFWGSNISDTSNRNGVKVFGMENYWGNQWRRFAGLILDSGTYKTKMCYGVSDGSTVKGYNLTGDGYVSSGITPGGTLGGYINIIDYSNGMSLPKTASGSSSTYYCDGLWFNNSIVAVAYRGGGCGAGARCGPFCLAVSNAASDTHWDIGAALSFKSP